MLSETGSGQDGMTNLYLTADRLGIETGGGAVTREEYRALQYLGECAVLSCEQLHTWREGPEPWCWDEAAVGLIPEGVRLCHGYAGTFGKSVRKLKDAGAVVSWTVAAHDRFISRKEHESYGINFAALYPHLCEEELWNRYISGYRAADIIVCPSEHSRRVVEGYGNVKRIEVIPHGCDLPSCVTRPPTTFCVGYLGSCGAADKGVRYLLEAWKKLAYTDALLILAGNDSCSPHVAAMIRQFGGGSIYRAGWQKNVSEFYNGISLYVQPSVTEGFGLEVLEAAAHGRAVLVSTGAGAADIIPDHARDAMTFPAGDVDALCQRIDNAKKNWDLESVGKDCREIAEGYTWDKIRERYVRLWKEMLACG